MSAEYAPGTAAYERLMTYAMFGPFLTDDDPAPAPEHENPLFVGHACDKCGARLDKAERPCPLGCA